MTVTASPCVNICLMDEASGLCRGCWRTLAEIGVWAAAGDEEKQAILAAVAARRSHREGNLAA